jgi:uncharacterized protein YndB with AHSA1/START domain
VARYVGPIESPISPEQTFDYLADFSSVAEWDPSAVRARMLADAPGQGAEFEVVVRFAGRELPLRYHTIAYERPHRLVLRAETSTVVSEDTITVRPTADGGSLLTYEAELRPKGAMRLADPVIGLLFRRLGDNAAAGLRAQLGSTIPK